MEKIIRIPKTDLARNTRQVIRSVQRGQATVIENHGEEEAVILDILDYRILRAVMRHYSHPQKAHPSGLSDDKAKGQPDIQSRWDLVIAYYLTGAISLARAAELLDLSTFELRSHFQRLDVPLRMGADDVDEIQSDLSTARAIANQK